MDIDCWHFNCDWALVLRLYKYWFVFKEPILGLSCWLWMDCVHVCLWSECGYVDLKIVSCSYTCFLKFSVIFHCYFHNDCCIISIWWSEWGMCNLAAFWFGYWRWHTASFLHCAGVWARILKLVCSISWSNSRVYSGNYEWCNMVALICQLVLLPVDWLIVCY
jgi:hypothetical protein